MAQMIANMRKGRPGCTRNRLYVRRAVLKRITEDPSPPRLGALQLGDGTIPARRRGRE